MDCIVQYINTKKIIPVMHITLKAVAKLKPWIQTHDLCNTVELELASKLCAVTVWRMKKKE